MPVRLNKCIYRKELCYRHIISSSFTKWFYLIVYKPVIHLVVQNVNKHVRWFSLLHFLQEEGWVRDMYVHVFSIMCMYGI